MIHRSAFKARLAKTPSLVLGLSVVWMIGSDYGHTPMQQAELSPPATPAELNVAASALADTTVGPFFPAGRITEAVSLVRRIHLKYPETRYVAVMSESPGLQFLVPDSLCIGDDKQTADEKTLGFVDRWLNPSRTGIVAFDRITEQMGGAKEMHLECIGTVISAVTVFYRQPVNIPGVARAYAGLQGISLSPLQDISPGRDDIQIEARDSDWTVTMWDGWGDCPSGCVHYHLWKFSYHRPTGKITVVTDSGPPPPRGKDRQNM